MFVLLRKEKGQSVSIGTGKKYAWSISLLEILERHIKGYFILIFILQFFLHLHYPLALFQVLGV